MMGLRAIFVMVVVFCCGGDGLVVGGGVLVVGGGKFCGDLGGVCTGDGFPRSYADLTP